MLEITLFYSGYLRDGQHVQVTNRTTETGREDKQPPFHGSSIQCDLDEVDRILTSVGYTVKVFWAKDVCGPDGDPSLLLKGGYRDLALISLGDDHTWILRAEPTMDKRIGLTVADEQNRVRLIGIGDLVEIGDSKKSYEFVATYHEVYSWGTSNPSSCEHLHAGHNKHRNSTGGTGTSTTTP